MRYWQYWLDCKMSVHVEQEATNFELVLQENSGKIILEGVTLISNSTASEYDSNKNTVCQRTGFKVKAGTLVQEWTGAWVRADSWEPRSQQDFVRNKAEEQRGAFRPESTDVFIVTSIAPEDL